MRGSARLLLLSCTALVGVWPAAAQQLFSDDATFLTAVGASNASSVTSITPSTNSLTFHPYVVVTGATLGGEA